MKLHEKYKNSLKLIKSKKKINKHWKKIIKLVKK